MCQEKQFFHCVWMIIWSPLYQLPLLDSTLLIWDSERLIDGFFRIWKHSSRCRHTATRQQENTQKRPLSFCHGLLPLRLRQIIISADWSVAGNGPQKLESTGNEDAVEPMNLLGSETGRQRGVRGPLSVSLGSIMRAVEKAGSGLWLKSCPSSEIKSIKDGRLTDSWVQLLLNIT